ncbi:MAG: ECF transporter S component [Coriobacteriia bacterium]|nr:ECF transporter S component [Coriobacteriia bacterium]
MSEQPISTTRASYLTQLALLAALVVVMTVTSLGYLPIGPLAITLMMVPVALGAIKLGPLAGGVLGTVFGLTSFTRSLFIPGLINSLIGIDPVAAFALCVVPRLAMGVCVGYIYRVLKDSEWAQKLALPASFFSSAALNTVFFVTVLMVLFGRSEFIVAMQDGLPVLEFITALVAINGFAEMIAATVLGTTLALVLKRAKLL